MMSKEMNRENVKSTIDMTKLSTTFDNEKESDDKRMSKEKRKVLFEAIIKNCQAVTYDNGIPALCSCDIPLELLFVDERYQCYREHKKIKILLDKWNVLKLFPIIVVPHFEDYTFSIVDGKGRYIAAPLKGMSSLPALSIMNAPRDPDERLKFESNYFSNQNTENEKLQNFEKHPSLVINGEEAAVILDIMCKKYNIEIHGGKGMKGRGVLGCYSEAYTISKTYGSEGLDFIFGIIENAGWHNEHHAYGRKIVKGLSVVYAVHPGHRKETFDLLSNKLKYVSPKFFIIDARSHYPQREDRSAVSLYLEDIVCKNLKIERRIFNEHQKFII